MSRPKHSPSLDQKRRRHPSRLPRRVELLEDRCLLTAVPEMLKDITPGNVGSYPSGFVDVNGTLFFSAAGGLWKSDGTSTGTVLVKDAWPGSYDYRPEELTNINGTLFFFAGSVSTTGRELWKSDGTSTGTVLVKDIYPGIFGSSATQLTEVNGTAFFVADDGLTARELWKSDGTSAGTILVKDINPGNFYGYPYSSYTWNLTNLNGTLVFRANDGTNGSELWESDGTSAGTVLLVDIVPGSGSSFPHDLTVVNGELFFGAADITHGDELWKSDGTANGTVLVKDVRPGSSGAGVTRPLNSNGTLFFTAFDLVNGSELWKSDGTSTGTVLVKDIRPGTEGSMNSFAWGEQKASVNGMLFFYANDGTNGSELWKSDGTSAGTKMLKDILPGSAGFIEGLTAVGGMLYFIASDGGGLGHGTEVWQSDGTTAGTTLTLDIWPGTNTSSPIFLANFNGNLVFRADNGVNGPEPWIIHANPATSTVTSRQLFYNRSSFDGNNADINTSDDAAIAVDKTAYLPGDGLAVFENVSSYSRGINGIMIDLVGGGTHGAISLSTLANDFVFKVGNNNTPSSWAAAPTPNAVSLRANFDGSGTDRLTITWADGDIKNQWLEVQVLPTSRTGLTSTDVFFWGNKIGDVGNPTATSFTTTASGDAAPIVSGGLGPASGITDPRDIDRSGVITAAGDRGAATSNIGFITRLDIGTGGPFAPIAGPPISTGGDFGIASALAARAPSANASEGTQSPAINVAQQVNQGRHLAAVADYFRRLAEQPTWLPSVASAEYAAATAELLSGLELPGPTGGHDFDLHEILP